MWLTWYSYALASDLRHKGAMLIAVFTYPGWLSDHQTFANRTVTISLSLTIVVLPFVNSLPWFDLDTILLSNGSDASSHGRDPVLYRLSNDTVPMCRRRVDLQ